MKWDGYRALGYVRGGEARLVSRNDNDLTARFPDVAKALAKAARSPECVVDGEVCALDEKGGRASRRCSRASPARRSSTRSSTCSRSTACPSSTCRSIERRERLEALLDARQKTVQISGAFDDGEALYDGGGRAGARGRDGEAAGVALPRGQAHARLAEDQDARPPGVRDLRLDEGPGPARRALRRARARRRIAATSCTGSATAAPASASATIDELLAKLEPLATDDARRSPSSRRCRRCARATSCGSSRSSSARSSSRSGRTTGICARRRSRGCARTSRRARCTARSRSRRAEGRVKLSNLDKVFWPDEGITKGDLLDYYRAVAPVLLPHLRDRPFTMRRYPDGAFGKAFFQKDAPKHMPEWIPRFRVAGVDAREAARGEVDRGADRERRGRAALDGEHGLHRHEHVVLARRQARPSRLRALRPRPVAGRRLQGDGPGGAAREGRRSTRSGS